MNPEIAKRITGSTDGVELVKFISQTILLLNSLDEVELTNDPVEIAVEVKARKLAVDKLKEILTPLISAKDLDYSKPTSNEYLVDVV